jgi:RNA polymerase sigma-70 factor (ECF subfamily)
MVWDDTGTSTRGAVVALREPAGSDRGRTADEAFAALTRRHLDGAYRLAWAILGGTNEAEDAVQDAFAMAWRKRSSLREPDRFDAWFGKILVNVCRERLRGMARSRVREVRVTPVLGDEAPERPAPAGPDIGLRITVGGALADLDPDHRVVVVLRYWADLTVDEIADRVGVPPGTVKSRLHHALRALAPTLEDVR